MTTTSQDTWRPGNGRVLYCSCAAADSLAREVARLMLARPGAPPRVTLLDGVDFRFADGEVCVRLEQDVLGADVFLLQRLLDPGSARSIDDNLLATLAATRALREWGAGRISVVLPYLAYARQDKPTPYRREPVTLRLVADLMQTAGADRVITFHPHTEAVRGFFGRLPLDALDPVPALAERFARERSRDDTVVVAPDLGAAGLAGDLAQRLELPRAVAHKERARPGQVAAVELLGMGRYGERARAIIVDDMLASGGTMARVVERLAVEHGVSEVQAAVSHNLCTGSALATVEQLAERRGLVRLIVSDSVPQTPGFAGLPFVEVQGLAPLIEGAIARAHDGGLVVEGPHRWTGTGRHELPRAVSEEQRLPPPEVSQEVAPGGDAGGASSAPGSPEERPPEVPPVVEPPATAQEPAPPLEQVLGVARGQRRHGPPEHEPPIGADPESLGRHFLEDATESDVPG